MSGGGTQLTNPVVGYSNSGPVYQYQDADQFRNAYSNNGMNKAALMAADAAIPNMDFPSAVSSYLSGSYGPAQTSAPLLMRGQDKARQVNSLFDWIEQ